MFDYFYGQQDLIIRPVCSNGGDNLIYIRYTDNIVLMAATEVI